jgi:hypothetical protein
MRKLDSKRYILIYSKYTRINQRDMLDIILPLLADDTKHETKTT